MASGETPERVVHRITAILAEAGVSYMMTGFMASGFHGAPRASLEWAKMSGSERQLEHAAGIVRIQGERLDRQYIERWTGPLALEIEWEPDNTGAVQQRGSRDR